MDFPSEYPTFYVDDSVAEIAGRKHVILAGISFADEEQAISEWLNKKRLCGLPPYEEVKWGSRTLGFEQRREFVPTLNRGLGIAVIHEGGKQAAAEELLKQLWFYSNAENKQGFRARFDRGIIQDWPSFRKSANSYFPPCVGISEHDSASEQLLQCADFLAGCIKLKVSFGLGVRDPNQRIEHAKVGETELGFLFFAALRYCLWGDVKDYGDGDICVPLKSTWNKGLVVVSSLPEETVSRAVAFLDGDYMGCIH